MALTCSERRTHPDDEVQCEDTVLGTSHTALERHRRHNAVQDWILNAETSALSGRRSRHVVITLHCSRAASSRPQDGLWEGPWPWRNTGGHWLQCCCHHGACLSMLLLLLPICSTSSVSLAFAAAGHGRSARQDSMQSLPLWRNNKQATFYELFSACYTCYRSSVRLSHGWIIQKRVEVRIISLQFSPYGSHPSSFWEVVALKN